jgi:hypothetical protein
MAAPTLIGSKAKSECDVIPPKSIQDHTDIEADPQVFPIVSNPATPTPTFMA